MTLKKKENSIYVIKNIIQFTFDIQKKRNIQVHSDENKIIHLKKRFKQYDKNRGILDVPVKKCLDEIISIMKKCTKD